MKISAYDRLNALIRSKLYRSDYSEYIEKGGRDSDIYVGEGKINDEGMVSVEPVSYHISLSKAGNALCKKWGLVFPVDPRAKPIEDYLYCLNRPIEFISDPSQWKTSQANTLAGSDDKIFTHINGKLAILIDLSFSKEKLRSEFDRFIDRWGEKQKRGPHGHAVNKWDVYDKKKEGNNLLGITREIYGIEESPYNHPNYDETVNAYYNRVKRAYKSAYKIINKVEEMSTM